jgi:hypothetical protein
MIKKVGKMGRRKGTARQLIKQNRKPTQTKYEGD